MNEIEQIRARIREKMQEMAILSQIAQDIEEKVNEGRGEDEDHIAVCDFCFGCNCARVYEE